MTKTEICRLKLRMSNAYLIRGTRPILVDSGSPGEVESIRKKLRAVDVEFGDLALVIHTHVHSDHFGNTAAIATEAACPVAYHRADQLIVDHANNGKLRGVGLRGKVMSRLFSGVAFAPMNADWFVSEASSLVEFGCDAKVLETPGHTPGSISIVTSAGDAVIGDVIMGGWMGGQLMPRKPNYHYFADDLLQTMNSLDTILNQTSGTLYVGHGGPLTRDTVEAWRRKH